MRGPVFNDIVLVDEINRATPKTQSALLEAMAEGQVTVGNQSYALSQLFFVMATQNPYESEGAYPLPLAQLDRFLFKLAIGYPNNEAEFALIKENPSENLLSYLPAVATMQQIANLKATAGLVFCDDKLIEKVVHLAQDSRKLPALSTGLSPRGAQALIKVAKVWSLFKGRDYITDEDLIYLAPPLLKHRLIVASSQDNIDEIIANLIDKNLAHF
jgi:MoxR-like ATPase